MNKIHTPERSPTKWLRLFTILIFYRIHLTALAILLSFVLFFLPLIMHWTNGSTASAIIVSINTPSFQFSIVIGIAVAVQGFIETTIDVTEAAARSKRHKKCFIGFVPRYLILFALSLPNIIIFAIGIPLQNSVLVLIFFQSQYTIALLSVIVVCALSAIASITFGCDLLIIYSLFIDSFAFK